MKFSLIILVAFLLLNCKTEITPDVNQLIDIDKQFSEVAGKIGFNKAFIEFAHTDAVLLRENSMPIIGKTAIEKLFEKADTSGIVFSWEPLAGDIAERGDLGYTYGIYTLKKDSTEEKGTYVSIWKKDGNKNWKYVLDTGNEGLGEESSK